MKQNHDYIFTKDIDGKAPLYRKTLTRIVNNELKSVGFHLNLLKRLTSRNFQIWKIIKLKNRKYMINKQLLNVLMITLGFALA